MNNFAVVEYHKGSETYLFVFTKEEQNWLKATGIPMTKWSKMALNLFGWRAVCKDWM